MKSNFVNLSPVVYLNFTSGRLNMCAFVEVKLVPNWKEKNRVDQDNFPWLPTEVQGTSRCHTALPIAISPAENKKLITAKNWCQLHRKYWCPLQLYLCHALGVAKRQETDDSEEPITTPNWRAVAAANKLCTAYALSTLLSCNRTESHLLLPAAERRWANAKLVKALALLRSAILASTRSSCCWNEEIPSRGKGAAARVKSKQEKEERRKVGVQQKNAAITLTGATTETATWWLTAWEPTSISSRTASTSTRWSTMFIRWTMQEDATYACPILPLQCQRSMEVL